MKSRFAGVLPAGVLLGAALLAAVLLAVSACSGEESRRPTAPVAVTSTPVPEPLTPQVAAREFRAYLANDDVARASGDERLALNWVSDGQAQLTAAEFRKAAFDGEPVPRYQYSDQVLYVPRLVTDIYPHWFVAVAERTERTERPAPGQTGRPGQSGRPASETSIMTMIRRSADTPWQLSHATVRYGKAKLPEILVDEDGYATALSTTDRALLISPKSLPGIQSAIAEEGPQSVPARLMKPGEDTTGLYRLARKVREDAEEDGLVSNPVFPATLFPIFALRTEDEGALVMYALSRDTVTYAEGHKGVPPVPHDAAHLLDGLEYGNELHVVQTLQFAAYDPPKEGGRRPARAEVIASAGAVTRAVASRVKGP